MNIPLIIIAIIILIIIICIIVNHIYSDKTIEKNMHHYAYYNKEDSKIYYNIIEPFIRSYESVYMSDSLKNNIFQSIDDHLKLNKLNKKLNYPKSLRLIISGKESIGKTTLIESIASYFNLGLIHFPKNYYSEKMIHIFFQDINNEFKNIFRGTPYSCPCVNGTGICGQGIPNISVQNIRGADIGGTLSFQLNVIHDCTNAIDLKTNLVNNVLNNTIYRINNSIKP